MHMADLSESRLHFGCEMLVNIFEVRSFLIYIFDHRTFRDIKYEKERSDDKI